MLSDKSITMLVKTGKKFKARKLIIVTETYNSQHFIFLALINYIPTEKLIANQIQHFHFFHFN